MKVWKLEKYADDGALSEVADAQFLRTKCDHDSAFDFGGITSISAAFLAALFDGETAATLDGRVLNTNGIQEALDAWADPQAVPAAKKPPRRKPAVVAKPLPERLEFATAKELEGARYTPTRLVARLRHQLRSYIESAYPLADPLLVRERRLLLETADDGKLLAQEPLIETTPRYRAFAGGYGDLKLPEHIGSLYSTLAATPQGNVAPAGPDGVAQKPKSILYPSMYQHQADAFREFLVNRRDLIVATGTGSGKTECFLVPILGSLFDEANKQPTSFKRPGVRVLILYPMNALVNDQLARLRLLLGERATMDAFSTLPAKRHPTFGMYTGRTPYPGPREASKDGSRVGRLLEYYTGLDPHLSAHLKNLGRFPAKDLEKFLGKELEETKVKSSNRHHWDKRLHTSQGDAELLTRHEMIKGAGSLPGDAPDVLVTNYSMLEYMLMRPFERPLFEQTRQWLTQKDAEFLIVLDEAHMYRGAQGAEVSFLLRRLRARLGIHDRPEKLRVICTSASLGSSDEDRRNITRFAADLTGKKPGDFTAITGQRHVPEPCAAASTELGDALAAVDLETLHVMATPEALKVAIEPVLAALKKNAPKGATTDELSRELYVALRDHPVLNMLLRESSARARTLTDLAEVIFRGHPGGKRATEVLVTLGTIAREEPDQAGLIPTRVHAFFRGLSALYACVNPACTGRREEPGEQAIVGKLFTTSRTNCDACGSRVYELGSCRGCGAAFLLGYAPTNQLGTLDFLWGETEGTVTQVQVLPSAPRYPESTEEVSLHLKTGFLGQPATGTEARAIWFAHSDDTGREALFRRCPMCQPPESRSRSRISDFETRGEQPFTALIEAQFAEQPPQKNDVTLPNRGRKVLVFSDGRQKAARLAPALEYSHARDLFRQLMALGIDALEKETGRPALGHLYPAVLWASRQKGIDLFPAKDEEIFHNHLKLANGRTLKQMLEMQGQGLVQPTKSFALQLFDEVTDKYFSLASVGLATLEEDPALDYLYDGFPDVGLDVNEQRIVLRAWLRSQVEARCFLPPGADLGALAGPTWWEGPDGIDVNRVGDIFRRPFEQYLAQLVDVAGVAAIKKWFDKLVRKGFLLQQSDRFYLQPAGLCVRLRLNDRWLTCSSCGRLYAEAVRDVCPACLGTVELADPAYLDARTGYYRDQVRRAFSGEGAEPFGLTTAEHSAQLTGKDDTEAFNRTEKYELRFQDLAIEGEPPIDVLSCTTTMEVGIDIGTLSGVALRNVPPHVANYQQRAGRAGRRGKSVASVVTYAQGTTHDSYYFERPERMVSGPVRSPIVYVENQQVLARHIRAYVMQRFFHETVAADSDVFQLFESLGTVEQFLGDKYPCSLSKLEAWLKANAKALKDEVSHWAPTRAHGLDEDIDSVGETINEAIDGLPTQLRRVLPVAQFPLRESMEGLARESLERALEERLLDTLLERAVFPRYAFPTDIVNFWVLKRRAKGDPAYKRNFLYEPSRDLKIALSEYAPGRSITIDKLRFTTAALYSPYEADPGLTLDRARGFVSCKSCGFVSVRPEAASFEGCPCCRSTDLVRQQFITPQGFAADVNLPLTPDRGETQVKSGSTTRAQLVVQNAPAKWDSEQHDGRLSVISRSQDLVVVNKGVGDRGFLVCRKCGRTGPVPGPGFPQSDLMKKGQPVPHDHPLEEKQRCDGKAEGPFFLGHEFPTDVLLLRLRVAEPVSCGTANTPDHSGPAVRSALTSLVEAIALAASRVLQIDEGELSGNWAPVLGGTNREVYVFLYDLLPGGAGYTRQVQDRLEEVLTEAKYILGECDCESSCYRCLRNYGNVILHPSLDRNLALAMLSHIRRGDEPTVQTAEVQQLLAPLVDTLRLRGFKAETAVKRGKVTVPAVIDRKEGGEVWLDVHHALVDSAEVSSSLQDAAFGAGAEFVSIDSYSLRHDLPRAVQLVGV
jgi:ATP-dependent helicase YprA (DUF1998 family)